MFLKVNTSNYRIDFRAWLCLAGFVFVYLSSVIIIFHASHNFSFSFSFFKVWSLEDAYFKSAAYLLVLVFYLLSSSWAVLADVPIHGVFQWKRPGFLFYAALMVGVGYVVVTFIQVRYRLMGPEYWPPLVLLSLLNSFGEEFFYRAVLFGLLAKTLKNNYAVIIFQAVLYGLIHVPLGNYNVALLALMFGLILGLVRYKENSIIPCILLHFVVDISAIGQSFLRYYIR